MFLLVLESDYFSPFILEVLFGVNCRAERLAHWGPSSIRSFHFTFRIAPLALVIWLRRHWVISSRSLRFHLHQTSARQAAQSRKRVPSFASLSFVAIGRGQRPGFTAHA
jgi:hypothetical protein